MSQLQVFKNSPVKASSIIGTSVVNPKGGLETSRKSSSIPPAPAGSHMPWCRLAAFQHGEGCS